MKPLLAPQTLRYKPFLEAADIVMKCFGSLGVVGYSLPNNVNSIVKPVKDYTKAKIKI